jgi:hypothetical protein
MARKLKLNLSGLKNQVKTGTITIDYLNGKVDYPIKLKNDREYKYILNLSDYKYKTKLIDDKLIVTNLQKLSNIKPEYRDVIMNSEGHSNKDISYVKIYDENELQVAKNDRETMLEGITVVAHLDLDYVVDEKTGETFLDLINNTFNDIIKEKYDGKKIEKGDYYKVTEILFEANLLSYDVINEFLIYIRALKYGRTVEEEKYRLEAQNLGVTEESDIQKWIEVRKGDKLLKEMKEKELKEDIVENVAIDKEENKNKELDIVEAEKVEEKE